MNEREDWFRRAYQLAWLVHRSRQVAYLIALEAMYRWEAMPPQGQRLLSKEQKFQRLVFEVSEHFEKAIEAINAGKADRIEKQIRDLIANLRHLETPEQTTTTTVRKFLGLLAPITLEDTRMMTHYLKHLAQLALRHSPVKITVGLTQLLYRLPTGDAREIYEHLEPALDRNSEAKDLQYFAKARREVLEELLSRFGQFLPLESVTTHNQATSKQLKASSATIEQAEFAADCLREFAPWDVQRTSCTPQRFNNKGEFAYQLLCPEQFNVVLGETRLAEGTACHLFWPQFINMSEKGGPSSPNSPPPLRGRELRAALAWLGRANKRRRQWRGGLMRIAVDGTNAAFLDLSQSRECKLEVSASASAIEVLARAKEGDILLAHCMLSEEDFDPSSGETRHIMPLEGGQKITFIITPHADGTGGEVSIQYQKRDWLHWLPIQSGLSGKALPYGVESSGGGSMAINRWKLTSVLLAAGLTLFLGLAALQAARFHQTVKQADNALPELVPPKKGAGGDSGQTTLGGPENGASGQSSGAGKRHSLCEVQNLYFEMNGGNTRLYQEVQAQLVHKLSAPGAKLMVAAEKAKTNATLKIKADWRYGFLGWLSDTTVIEVGLYSNAGNDPSQALWPQSTSGRQYEGKCENVIDKIALDFVEAKLDDCKK